MTTYRRPLQAVLDPEQGWTPRRREADPDLCREDYFDRLEREAAREAEQEVSP